MDDGGDGEGFGRLGAGRFSKVCRYLPNVWYGMVWYGMVTILTHT